MTDWLLPFLCGLGAAVISAWGVGGGTLLLLVMTLFLGVDQRMAQGINLLFFVPIILLSVGIHLKNKLIDVKTSLLCAAIGAGATVGGFYLGRALDNEILRSVFAAFIILAGAKDLLSKSVDK